MWALFADLRATLSFSRAISLRIYCECICERYQSRVSVIRAREVILMIVLALLAILLSILKSFWVSPAILIVRSFWFISHLRYYSFVIWIFLTITVSLPTVILISFSLQDAAAPKPPPDRSCVRPAPSGVETPCVVWCVRACDDDNGSETSSLLRVWEEGGERPGRLGHQKGDLYEGCSGQVMSRLDVCAEHTERLQILELIKIAMMFE